MIDDPELRDAGCGTIQYSIVAEPNVLPSGSEVFRLELGGNLPSVIVDASDRLLVDNSPFSLKVVATLGNIDSKESDPLQINFSNTCLDTEFIAKNIQTMTAQLNDPTVEKQTVLPFEDTVSKQYGTGIGICGGQTYEIFELVNGERMPASFIYMTIEHQNQTKWNPMKLS